MSNIINAYQLKLLLVYENQPQFSLMKKLDHQVISNVEELVTWGLIEQLTGVHTDLYPNAEFYRVTDNGREVVEGALSGAEDRLFQILEVPGAEDMEMLYDFDTEEVDEALNSVDEMKEANDIYEEYPDDITLIPSVPEDEISSEEVSE